MALFGSSSLMQLRFGADSVLSFSQATDSAELAQVLPISQMLVQLNMIVRIGNIWRIRLIFALEVGVASLMMVRLNLPGVCRTLVIFPR
jgi:hypothetical protein